VDARGLAALEIDGAQFQLKTGDCLRFLLAGSTRFEAGRRRQARYVIAMDA
jgi:hypothetical protein